MSGKNPLCRLDNLVEEQFKKLITIVNISNELDIPIISGGDLTDSPNIAYSTYTTLAKVLNKCRRGFYTVFGNHDLQFHTMNTATSVALGALIESCPTVKHIEDFTLDYGIEIDYEDWDDKKYITKNTHSKILICHRAIISNFLMSRNWIKKNVIDFYNIQEKGIDKYKLILCGHYHKQYEIIKNQIILNPGCFTRRNANDIEIHKPSYYIIDLDTFDYEFHSLPNCKGIEDVVSDSHLTYTRMAKNMKGEIAEFFKSIKHLKNTNKFYINMLESFNNLEEGSFKNTMRMVLMEVFGEIIEGVELHGLSRFPKTKRHTLQKRSEE